MTKTVPPRATAVLTRGGDVLLVQERKSEKWSLPGGQIRRRESATEAIVREIDEELAITLAIDDLRFYFVHHSAVREHRVFGAEVNEEPTPSRDVKVAEWWDCKSELDIRDSARAILERVGLLKPVPVPATP